MRSFLQPLLEAGNDSRDSILEHFEATFLAGSGVAPAEVAAVAHAEQQQQQQQQPLTMTAMLSSLLQRKDGVLSLAAGAAADEIRRRLRPADIPDAPDVLVTVEHAFACTSLAAGHADRAAAKRRMVSELARARAARAHYRREAKRMAAAEASDLYKKQLARHAKLEGQLRRAAPESVTESKAKRAVDRSRRALCAKMIALKQAQAHEAAAALVFQDRQQRATAQEDDRRAAPTLLAPLLRKRARDAAERRVAGTFFPHAAPAVAHDLRHEVDRVAVRLASDMHIPRGRPPKRSQRCKADRPIVKCAWGAGAPTHSDAAAGEWTNRVPALRSWSRFGPPEAPSDEADAPTSTPYASAWRMWRSRRRAYRADMGALRRGGLRRSSPKPPAGPARAASEGEPGQDPAAAAIVPKVAAPDKETPSAATAAPTYPPTRRLSWASPHRLRRTTLVHRRAGTAPRPEQGAVRARRLEMLHKHDRAVDAANQFQGLSVLRFPTVACAKHWIANTADAKRFDAARSALVADVGFHPCSVREEKKKPTGASCAPQPPLATYL